MPVSQTDWHFLLLLAADLDFWFLRKFLFFVRQGARSSRVGSPAGEVHLSAGSVIAEEPLFRRLLLTIESEMRLETAFDTLFGAAKFSALRKRTCRHAGTYQG